MRFEEMPGEIVAESDGRRLRLISALPLESNGRETLFFCSVAIETADGSHRHGAIPLVASPGAAPRDRPKIIRPVELFDAAGELLEFLRPIAEHVRDLAWVGMDGTPHAIVNDWPKPVRRMSEADQVRRRLEIPPGLDELEVKVGARRCRLAGVDLVAVDGADVRDRDPADIKSDAIGRVAFLRLKRGPVQRIADLEALVARLDGAGAAGDDR